MRGAISAGAVRRRQLPPRRRNRRSPGGASLMRGKDTRGAAEVQASEFREPSAEQNLLQRRRSEFSGRRTRRARDAESARKRSPNSGTRSGRRPRAPRRASRVQYKSSPRKSRTCRRMNSELQSDAKRDQLEPAALRRSRDAGAKSCQRKFLESGLENGVTFEPRWLRIKSGDQDVCPDAVVCPAGEQAHTVMILASAHRLRPFRERGDGRGRAAAMKEHIASPQKHISELG